MQTNTLEKQISLLQPYLDKILSVDTWQKKLKIIDAHPAVREFLAKPQHAYGSELDYIIHSLVAIGQGKTVLGLDKKNRDEKKFEELLNFLLEVEKFYESIGGIIGYHVTVLKLICGKEVKRNVHYKKPHGLWINEESLEVRNLVRVGIENLSLMAEIYPVGGAGDRLDLKHEATQEPLPAACLSFGDATLLELLIRDLQAREYLYYKLFDQQISIPIAMMTSHEKNNFQHILEICESQQWFGKDKSDFHFFVQPLVPVITKEGQWSTSAPYTLTLKPGGHGVIWKLAIDSGVFSKLLSQGRHKALIRQINNPIAGIDNGLLAFAGLGFKEDKAFGFAACPSIPHAAEGKDVLCESKTERGYEYSIANIEYTQFGNKDVTDLDQYPANTNILFIDLKMVAESVKVCPFPGMNINMKNKAPYLTSDGEMGCIEAGRLESTMQNISDVMTNLFDHPIQEEEESSLMTYLTMNDRLKTISVTKRSYVEGSTMLETPEGCFYDFQCNYHHLLKEVCGMKMPPLPSLEHFYSEKAPFIIHLHPALGPIFSIIGQKIRKGHFTQGSELRLEIAELEINDLTLNGSLHIEAESALGKRDSKYSHQGGKCVLRHVKVVNEGIDHAKPNRFWKNSIARKELLKIRLIGNGEFHAEDVTFEGPHNIIVENGTRMTAYMKSGKVCFKKEKISSPTWFWKYSFDQESRINIAGASPR